MGLTEAVYNAVPVIVFPIFAEQDFNAFRYERVERGIKLELSTVTASKLKDAFDEIRANSK